MTDDGPDYTLAFTFDDSQGTLDLLVFDNAEAGAPVDSCTVGAELDGAALEQAVADLLNGEPWPADAPMQHGHHPDPDDYDDPIVEDFRADDE